MRTSLLFLFAASSLALTSASAQAPDWWSEHGVINAEGIANDFAPLNQGQVKNLATAGMIELLENLPQGVDTGIWEMVDAWRHPTSSTNDFAPVNLGQLKNLAAPFYARLIEVGYWTGDYPWVNAGTPNDYALANVGQAKNLFAFDVTVDSGSGIPDWWEIKWFGQAGAPGSGSDPSPGDPGVALIDAYLEGRDPTALGEDGPGADTEVGLVIFLPF